MKTAPSLCGSESMWKATRFIKPICNNRGHVLILNVFLQIGRDTYLLADNVHLDSFQQMHFVGTFVFILLIKLCQELFPRLFDFGCFVTNYHENSSCLFINVPCSDVFP